MGRVEVSITFVTNILYLLTPWCGVLLEKLTGLQLVKKFPAFHGTRRFITALTSVRHLSILGQPNPVHIPTSHLLEIHHNITHTSTPRSPQWSPSLRFPHQDPIHPLSSPIRATCPAHRIYFTNKNNLKYKFFGKNTMCLSEHSAIRFGYCIVATVTPTPRMRKEGIMKLIFKS